MIQRFKTFFTIKKSKISPHYSGLSDFMLNATPEEKNKIITQAARQANEDQHELVEKYDREFSKV